MRLTIACPEALIGDANHLARALGHGPDDERTFEGLNWQDADGNLYAVAAFDAPKEWAAATQAPLSEPEWGADLAAAGRAQAKIAYWSGAPDANVPPGKPDIAVPVATPDTIVAVAGIEALPALLAMGLERVAVQDPV